MPTYVYRCDDCKHQFELVQRMSDDPIDTCPNCESKVRRVIHPVGVVFKGSGWYINDSRASSGKSSGDGNSGDSSNTKAKDSSSSDGTSNGKSDSKPTEGKKASDSSSRTTEKAAS
jgi:putative FmdB family regulatory protein